MSSVPVANELDSIIECWFDYCFYEKLQFPQVDLRILFFFFFSKSRVRVSSEFQTQTNCYMYAILLPVISATDLTS